MKAVKWVVRISAVLVVLTGVATALAIRQAAATAREKADVVRAAHQARAAANIERLVKIQHQLEGAPFFAAARPDKDAGPYLNPRILWEKDPSHALPPDVHPPSRPELALPQPLMDRVRDWRQSWLEHADDPELAQLDMAWMKGLDQYGYWDIFHGGYLEHVEKIDLTRLPLPNYIQLQTWAKLRLLRAHKTGDYPQASAELRQLAWLSWSSETLIGEMVGVAILSLEHTAHDAWARPGADLRGWQPVPREQLTQMKQAAWGDFGFFQPWTQPELIQRALQSPIGRCAALNEASIRIQFRRALQARVEPVLLDAIEQPRPPCRLEGAKRQLASPATVDEILAMGGNEPAKLSGVEQALVRFEPQLAAEMVEAVGTSTIDLDRFEEDGGSAR